jgi:hypothetical protein
MQAIAILVVGLAGYVAYAKMREGTDGLRSIGEATCVAALLDIMVSGVSSWLSGRAIVECAEFALSLLALSLTAALVGAFIAGLKPRQEPIPHW